MAVHFSVSHSFQPFIQVLEGEEWISVLLDLHEAVRVGMDNPAALKKRDPDHFRGLLNQENGRVLGLFVGGELIGSTALILSDSFEGAVLDKALTCSSGVLAHQKKEKVGTVQSFCVLPAHNGKGYGTKLVKAVVAAAHECGCRRVFSQVVTNNAEGQSFFGKNKFKLEAAWPGGDGVERKLYHLSYRRMKKLLQQEKGVNRRTYEIAICSV